MNHPAPIVTYTMRAGSDWLQQQAALDWRKTGLPDFAEWDSAIRGIARLVAMSSSPVALMLGPRGVLLANEAAEDLFIQGSGAVNARSVLDVMPSAAPFYAQVLKRGFDGQSFSYQKQAIRLRVGGQHVTRFFNLDFTPVCDEHGEIVGVLGTANDVTLLTRKIRDLSEAEQRMRVALESAGLVGVWTLDVKTGIRTADAAVANIYGVSVDDAARGVDTSRFASAIHPDDRGAVKATIMEAIATVTPYRNRYRLLDANGRVSWVITSANPVVDEEGNVTRMLGTIVDVTSQMETASALAESRFQFETLTETLPQIVWSCDANGEHDYFSPRWSEFTGINLDDVTEATWKMLVHPDDLAKVGVVWANALRTGEPYDLDYRFRHHSGEFRWLRVMALPIRDADGNIARWFGTSTDVHESYLLAEERERMARELVRIATEDQLTGALTRRAFFERANENLDPSRPATARISLLMLDIDHFKAINDNYGHPVGDKVLAATARQISASIRRHDFVGRLGGEEFSVFLPHCSPTQVMKIAERIRRSVQNKPVVLDDGRKIEVTLSIGATSIANGRADLDAMLYSADRALYRAKSGGRNRTEMEGSAS